MKNSTLLYTIKHQLIKSQLIAVLVSMCQALLSELKFEDK